MALVTLDFLTSQLALADQLHVGRATMFEPQDLPGRYGRVVKALDHVLEAIGCQSVVGSGWAVWRHGYVGRVTQDVDIILPAARVGEFLRTASVAAFQVLPVPAGRWPKLLHRETGVDVDILPEGQRPGTLSKPAPTTIPHPGRVGASGTALKYLRLPPLIELKLAAGRSQDLADVIKLIQTNLEQIGAIRQHLAQVHGLTSQTISGAAPVILVVTVQSHRRLDRPGPLIDTAKVAREWTAIWLPPLVVRATRRKSLRGDRMHREVSLLMLCYWWY